MPTSFTLSFDLNDFDYDYFGSQIINILITASPTSCSNTFHNQIILIFHLDSLGKMDRILIFNID
jgi:hypothetical protein